MTPKPQANMTIDDYTEKILAEAMIQIKKHTHYRGGDLLDKHIENVLSTSITQALAEDRERVYEELLNALSSLDKP